MNNNDSTQISEKLKVIITKEDIEDAKRAENTRRLLEAGANPNLKTIMD